MKNYIGHDGFIWWIGVVESTDDPLQLGRCRVRCFGYHPKKVPESQIEEQSVPTDHLPWATCLQPTNLQNFYGRPNAGDWVIGFFLDALDAQEPVILGILPGIPTVVNEYFSAHPRFAKTFTKIKNDETPNRNQLINTLHSLVNTGTKQLVTLPEEGKFLSNTELQSIKTTLSNSEARSDKTFAFYHSNGSKLEIGDSANSKRQPISSATLKLNNGSYLELNKEIINEIGDTIDFTRLHHKSGSSLDIRTATSSGTTTDVLTLAGAQGAAVTITTTAAGSNINIRHPRGASISISPSGSISVYSPQNILINSPGGVTMPTTLVVNSVVTNSTVTPGATQSLEQRVTNLETAVGSLLIRVAALEA